MKVRVLGCHGSDQLLGGDFGSRNCRPCGFLVNDSLLLDAGTIGAALTLEEQRQIRHILVSHIHFDHIQGLPTLADNLADDEVESVEVLSIPEVVKGLRTYIFNGEVYPDFMQLPSPHRPVFISRFLDPRKPVEVGNLRVTAVPVNHQVPTVGFIIEDGAAAVLYSGDTFETEEIWEVARSVRNLKAVFIESSFPNALADLARLSKHLTPAGLAAEFRKIGRPDLPVCVYHLKPRFRDMITKELTNLGLRNLTVLQEGQEVVL